MKKVIYMFALILIGSCSEKLIEEPNNLISKDKMVNILNDIAILNAANKTNAAVLQKHDIEPMQYIYTKYEIDSLTFVESDRYYASIPKEHEKLYIAVKIKLEQEEERLQLIKRERDSIKKAMGKEAVLKKKSLKDSLLKSKPLKN